MKYIQKKPLQKWIILSSSANQGGGAIASKRLANLISKNKDLKVIFIYTNPNNQKNIKNLNKNIEVKYFPQSLIKKKLGSLITVILSRILGQSVSLPPGPELQEPPSFSCLHKRKQTRPHIEPIPLTSPS